MATIEQRLEQLEKSQKRYRFGMIGLLCLMIAGVSMGQTSGPEDIVCRSLTVMDAEANKMSGVMLIAGEDGGAVITFSPSGKELVALTATVNGEGAVRTFSPSGKELVALSATVSGNGIVRTFSPSGKELVALSATVDGGVVTVSNKTGENIVTLQADDYGNGVVGAWNRKGKGRTLESK